ncbi:MAG: hypothetical protein CME62_10720 [Halobacteriovoraceae bacterium]|nr:hypothetical protein [Halobacteriovoraceae bacterium]|tara:strand:- start:9259 stop:9699 length:441 start_codon:yes stop_codon:yes gene_type:complete
MRNVKITLSPWIISIVLISLLAGQSSYAQNNEDLDGLVKDTKSDLMMVIAGGLAGAVLGLSTLSFVEEPKEHTRNIVVGASLGIIAGVAYVAFSQANRTQTMLYEDEQASLRFDTRERARWHTQQVAIDTHPKEISPYSFAVSFRY